VLGNVESDWAIIGLLLGINLYAALLIVLRGVLFRIRIYRPMLLNLGLSWVPLLLVMAFWVGVAFVVARIEGSGWGPALIIGYLIGSLAMWTAFFPNASYLITELNFSHRRSDDPVPLWYDIIQTLTLTMAGIVNATISLAAVQLTFVALAFPNADSLTEPWGAWVFALVLLALGTIGVYIGRFVRLNSWDLVNPVRLVRILVDHVREAGNARNLIGFVVTYTVFLAVLYVPGYVLISEALFGG
jgi:uncharacterized membrane protein